jgi:ubiquinone/menaquinone biosynthesis C-methylase UbiE
MSFKDHFSKQAADYARFRPRYPREMFEYLGTVARSRALAWDCATGNGQAAVELAEVFGRVIATDASEKQIAKRGATRACGISRRVGGRKRH